MQIAARMCYRYGSISRAELETNQQTKTKVVNIEESAGILENFGRY